MNKQEQQDYMASYKKAKEKGVPFFPNILFKDAVVSLIVFVILIALATFVGVEMADKADPTDATYTPRPEWYFLFLFQLLKYFPGRLEVIGVVIVPSIAILLLFALPFIDSSRFRFFRNRLGVTIGTAVAMLAVIGLTVLALVEAPPPQETVNRDPTATLYTENCAGCHGPTINVPDDTNLHEIISQGSHEGMPSWNADLSADQIDALVGFILSPTGNQVFNDACAECHESTELIGIDPLLYKSALEDGQDFAPHQGVDVAVFAAELSQEQTTALLNYLLAPDGQRLFVTNCAVCHGSSVNSSQTYEEIRETIAEGGRHLEMPAWNDRLDADQIAALGDYLASPNEDTEAAALYQATCTSCHPGALPGAGLSRDEIVEVIATGGSHETMPVWGEVFTDAQLNAIAEYTFDAAQGISTTVGQQIYEANCVSCHGYFGEGGPNPTRPNDIIAPISTSEYLHTRDDVTLFSIVSAGQPNFGMSPFGVANGGPLDEAELNAVVAYIRSWEANPPVELPPDVAVQTVNLNAGELFAALCAQCHKQDATGDIGPSLRSASFKAGNTAETIFDSINLGHEATPMIAWGEILTANQIDGLVEFILSLPEESGDTEGPSFAVAVQPILDANCTICHQGDSPLGDWNSENYDGVVSTGENAPVVIAGDVEGSLLAQKLLDTQTIGKKMPPTKSLSDDDIQTILDWIAAGAQDN